MIRVLLFLLLLCLPVTAQPVQVYPPESKGSPTVLYLYEGEEVPQAVGELFVRLGFGCALAHPQDLRAATQAVAAAHRQLPGKLFVIGEGANGQLAAQLTQDVRAALALGPLSEATATKIPLTVLWGDKKEEMQAFQTRYAGLKIDNVGLSVTPSRELLLTDNSPVQKAVRHFLALHAPPPRRGLKGAKFLQSPNWDVRSLGGNIDVVVVHSTVINTLAGTERAFLNDKQNRVSAHYVVDRDGTIVQMVDENFTSWHAGVSELDGRTGVNDFSVGIEIVNLNDGKDPYTDAQYDAIVKIIRHLRENWNIPDSRIVSHAHIARPVGRKSDPLGFDFQRLYQQLRK